MGSRSARNAAHRQLVHRDDVVQHSGGDNDAEHGAHPPRQSNIVWGAIEAAAAATLLVAGGLKALQSASISAALPVSVIMLIMLYGLTRSLAREELGDIGRS